MLTDAILATGVVKRFNMMISYGVIQPDDGSPLVYVDTALSKAPDCPNFARDRRFLSTSSNGSVAPVLPISSCSILSQTGDRREMRS